MKLPKLNSISLEKIYNFSTSLSWGIRDKESFDKHMDAAKSLVHSGYYLGDNLFTWSRNLSVLEDDTFRQAWESNIQNKADQAILWRRYILACAGYHCIQLDGDFVECGVYLGTGIKTVMDYLGGKEFHKTFWGYDTFDYNPVEGHKFARQEDGLYQEVLNRFSGYKQVKLVKGLLPDAFAHGIPDKISYLHIDLNHANSEIAVLDHLFDRVGSGGIIILDDYEWSGVYRNQKSAEDPWFDNRNYRVFPLPTGQGLVIKH